MYVLCLKNIMKWVFGMDHYNYARWLTVHLFDLMHLHLTCHDLYNEFITGKFSFSKSLREFSKMAPDQVHEQNNVVIKSVNGAVNVLNREDQSALERWELCSPEISRILSKFESVLDSDQTSKTKHFELGLLMQTHV